MTTITARAEVDESRTLRLAVGCDLPPGPVEVVVVIRDPAAAPAPAWDALWGLGREVWRGVDAARYVAGLRADRGD
jgi:hypothetical protein